MGSDIFIKILFVALLLTCCGVALWQGGWPERISAAAILAASFATPLVSSNMAYTSPEYGILFIDGLAFASLLAVALLSDRYWPLFASAFHLLAVMIHLLTIIASNVVPLAYANLQAFWAWPMLVALGLGTWVEAPRKR